MKELEDIQSKVDQLKGQLIQLKKEAKRHRSERKDLVRLGKSSEEAKEIVKIVAMKTQSEISYHIKDITGLALSSVMSDPYELKLNFVERRGKIECDFLFCRDGIEIEPKDGGGGALDIGAFALRVASLSMQESPSRNILILDEPFKHLKGERANERMLEMVHRVSKKLNMQVIMVGDERVDRATTMSYADKLFSISIKKGISTINVKK